MPDIDLGRLEELATKATPGPWSWNHNDGDWGAVVEAEDAAGKETLCATVQMVELGRQFAWDAEYIAALDPDTVLTLLARLRAQAGIIAAAHAYHTAYGAYEDASLVADKDEAWYDAEGKRVALFDALTDAPDAQTGTTDERGAAAKEE